jgi:catechol 2,3-dioxygenase-like lactoylglutathione lyase family enzyme
VNPDSRAIYPWFMEQRVSLITIAVRDLPRSRRFYESGLGWKPSFRNDEIAFYQIGGAVFGLFQLANFLADTQLGPDTVKIGAVALAHNVRSQQEVDAVMGEAALAGARVLKPARETPWGGYSGYFADPDGQPWEVAFNPGWPLREDGTIAIPRGSE